MSSRTLDALPVGKTVTVRKTVSESDVYLFAGITGDLSPNHVDEEYMRKTRYGRRIAHGALAVGLMSHASTRILDGVPGTPSRILVEALDMRPMARAPWAMRRP